MNHFHHCAVVFVFLTACNYIAHGYEGGINLNNYRVETLDEILDKHDPDTFDVIYMQNYRGFYREKRGFFSMKIPSLFGGESVDDGKEVMADTTTTPNADTTTDTVAADMAPTAANVEAIYNGLLNAAQSQATHILSIGTDAKGALVAVAPYLPLVNKVTTHIVPDLSQHDVLTLSVNVAALTTQGIRNNLNAEPPTKSTVGGSISQYATGIYNKLKDAFKSHFGDDVPDNSSGKENTNNSSEEKHSIFDKVKSKISIFSSFMNSFDTPETQKNENKAETIVTHTYIDGSQTPTTDIIVTKKYEKGADSIHQITDSETKHVISSNKLLKNGKQSVDNVITDAKNEFNENLFKESNELDYDDDDLEPYDDDNIDGSNSSHHSSDDENMSNYDDDDENMIDDNVVIDEEDFKQVMQESMTVQPDFVQTLDGEELLEKIDELQKSLPNPNTNNRKIFEALIEELDIDERVDDDKVNELINGLEKTTNFFISSGIKKNDLLTIPPTLTPN